MGSASYPQINLIVSVVAAVFLVATLAALTYAIVKTSGTVRLLIMVSAALMLLSRLSFVGLTPLPSGLEDPTLLIVVPQLVSGAFGLASTICLIQAVVRAWQYRPALPPPYPLNEAQADQRPGPRPPAE